MNCLGPFIAVAFWLQCLMGLMSSWPYIYIVCAFLNKPVEALLYATAGWRLKAETERCCWKAAQHAKVIDKDEDELEKVAEEPTLNEYDDGDEDGGSREVPVAGFVAHRHVPSGPSHVTFDCMLAEQRTYQHEHQESVTPKAPKAAPLSGGLHTSQRAKLHEDDHHVTPTQQRLPTQLETEKEAHNSGEELEYIHQEEGLLCTKSTKQSTKSTKSKAGAVPATPQVNVAAVILERQGKRGRLTMLQRLQRQSARWQRISFTRQTGQLLHEKASRLSSQLSAEQSRDDEQQVASSVVFEVRSYFYHVFLSVSPAEGRI